MEKNFAKLSALVNDTFTVKKVHGYAWKKWDNESKKMMTRDSYEEGYRKVYQVETDKGWLDLGTGQMGTLLESVFQDGLADINLKTFAVKSNGKTGMDIRYFFNLVRDEVEQSFSEESYDDIPF